MKTLIICVTNQACCQLVIFFIIQHTSAELASIYEYYALKICPYIQFHRLAHAMQFLLFL